MAERMLVKVKVLIRVVMKVVMRAMMNMMLFQVFWLWMDRQTEGQAFAILESLSQLTIHTSIFITNLISSNILPNPFFDLVLLGLPCVPLNCS